MNIVSVALPATGFSAVLSLQTLDTNGPIGFGVGNGLTAADTFALYGTLDNLSVDASNAYDLGRFSGGDTMLSAGFAKQASTWPFLLVKRLTGSGTGSLYVAGNPLTLPSVVTTVAPTASAAFSAVMNLTTLNASQVRIGGSRGMTSTDSFDLYLSNDATIATTSTLTYAGRFTGGGGTNITSFAVSGFAYAIVQRVLGSTAGTIIAAGIAPSIGGGGSVIDLDTLPVGNTAVNGTIGALSAAASVDIYSSFLLAQTTAGVTATLPSPTVTTAGKVAFVMNASTATQSITMYGLTIGVGAMQTFEWTGAAWVGGKNLTQGGNAFGAPVVMGSTDNSTTVQGSAAGVVVQPAATGPLTAKSGTTGAATFDSGTTGGVNVGTGDNPKVVTVGNSNPGTEAHLFAGAGGIEVATGAGTGGAVSVIADGVVTIDTLGTTAINIGSVSPFARNVSVGNTADPGSVAIQSGSGGISLDNAGGTGAIGATAGSGGFGLSCSGAGTVAIRSGSSGTATFDSGSTGAVNIGAGANAKSVTVGSVTGAASTAVRAGSGGMTIVNNGTTYTWPSAAPTVNGQGLVSTTGGALTWSGVVNVQANNSGGQSIADGGGAAIITTWSEITDSASAFNSTTGIFTAPVTGFYQVCAELEFSAIVAVVGAEFSVQLYINGSLFAQAAEICQVAAANVKRQPKLSIGVQVTAGQTLDIRAAQTSGSGSNSLTFTTSRNLLSISLVS